MPGASVRLLLPKLPLLRQLLLLLRGKSRVRAMDVLISSCLRASGGPWQVFQLGSGGP